VPRIVGDDQSELIGYVDRWSVPAGDAIRLMVSTTAASFRVGVVRLRHGDPSPLGPGFVTTPITTGIDGDYPGVHQPITAGSYAVIDDAREARTVTVWAWPTLPADGRGQVITSQPGWRLFLDGDGYPTLAAGGVTLRAAAPVERERWVLLAVVLGTDHATLAVDGATTTTVCACSAATGPLWLAASPNQTDHYDGRLESATAFAAALADDALGNGTLGALRPDQAWDLRRVRLVNAPTLAVTGRRWRDDTTDFRSAPDEYAAVHFHSDDLDDAGWQPALAWTVPRGLRSGVYAFTLAAGALCDQVPFVVRPRVGAPTAPVAVLLPTLTYQVYGNERMISGGDAGMLPVPNDVTLDPADTWLAAHPAAGRSCYDYHRDRHGVSLVSALRPLPNVRPGFVWWLTGAPERFSADLYLIDWLDHLGVDYDVFTDHDLDADGEPLLAGYRVVLTGTHPEYTTHTMLDAMARYLQADGRLMYLGGNGFYWVTSIDPDRPHLAEVRRGLNGTRAWSSRPGELRHQTTGEQGGLWRYRGRDPNRLVGVGFTSQSDSHDRAPGYRRTPESYDPAYAWVFDGVEPELFGEYGLYLGGAAGYEIDRHDPAFGSPAGSVVLATSRGMHPASYLLVVEDMQTTIPQIDGTTSSLVRADVTVVPYPGGGMVFSVGSCSWCGSLSADEYDNDVSRITANVLHRFMQR
jgi:N,N-dimethylformamidase